MLQKLLLNKLPHTLVLCLWITLFISLCPDQAQAQNNGFSIQSDTVCNVDTGGVFNAYEETISFAGVPRAQDSVTIKLFGNGDLNFSSLIDEYLALRGEDSVYYDTLEGTSCILSFGDYHTVTTKVSAATFNQWLQDDDTVRFFLDPGNAVNSFCDCTSECDQSKPNCGISDVFYKAAIELTYPPLDTYQKTYGDSLVDEGLGVTRDGQGGAIVTGKTRSFGQGQEDAFLLGTDDKGNEQWYKTYGGSSNDVGKAVTRQYDSNGYLIAGYTESAGQGGKDVFVVKTDATGNVVWEQTYGGASDEEAEAIIRTADTGYLIAGYTESFGASGKDIYLLKIDTLGNITYDYHYGGTSDDQAYSIIQDSTNQLILTGGTKSYGSGGEDVFALKTSSLGRVNYFKTYGGSGDESGRSIIQTRIFSGDYVIGGRSTTYSSGGAENGIFLRLDTSGLTVDFNAYGGSSDDNFSTVREGSRDSFILAGSTKSYGNGGSDGFVVKVDSAGQVKWGRAFGDTATEALNGLASEANGGNFLATGEMSSFGLGKADVYLVSFESSGFGECNQTNLSNIAFRRSISSGSQTLSRQSANATKSSGLITNTPSNKTYVLCPIDADFSYRDTCWGDTTQFSDSTFDVTREGYTWDWHFGDTASPNNTDTAENPEHLFSSPDSFEVQLIASTGAQKDTATKTIGLQTKPFNILSSDTAICKYDSFKLNVDSTNYATYAWSPGSQVSDSTIAEPYAFPYDDSVISVQAADSQGCSALDTINVKPDSTTPLLPPDVEKLATQDSQAIKLSWDTADTRSRFFSYRIYRKQKGGSAFRYLDSIPNFDTTTWTDTSVTATDSIAYDYYIKTENQCGILSSASSTFRSVVLSDSVISDKKLQLKWTSSNTVCFASTYEVLYKADSTFKVDTSFPVGCSSSNTSYTRTACENDGEFRIRLIDTGPLVNDTVLSNTIDPDVKDTTPAPAGIASASYFGFGNENTYRIALTGSDSSDLESYILFRSINGRSYNTLDTFGDIKTTWSGPAYPDSSQVCYRVQTIDSCGNLSDTSKPHCLVNLKANAGNKANDLFWTPYTGWKADTVEVQRFSNGSWQEEAILPGTDTSYTDPNLVCNQAYTYRVKYYEAGGADTSISDSVTVRPFDTVSPDKPAIVPTTTLNNTTLQTSWTTSSGDVDRYVVYRGDSNGNFSAQDTLQSRTDTTYTDSFNSPVNRSYCYKVRAIDSCADNQSPLSAEDCSIYLTADTTGCEQQINLSWNAYTGFDSLSSYEIYRSPDSTGSNFQLLTTLNGNTTAYTDSQVSFDTTYTYEVRAQAGGRSLTATSNTSTSKPFKPDTPFVQAASKVSTSTTNGEVKISWKSQQGKAKLAKQRLYYKAPGANAFNILKDSLPLSQDSFIHKNLNTKTADHSYYLTNLDSCGNESDSSAIHQTMDLTFKVGQLLHDLSWTGYEGFAVDNYFVQRLKGGQFFNTDTLPAGDTTLQKSPQPCNSAFTYRIKAVDSLGNFSYSDTARDEALDTINPDRAQLRNVSIVKDGIVEVTFKGADSLDIFAYDIRRQRAGGNFQLTKRVLFDSAGGTFTIQDTTATRQDQLCYTILTQDSCLNTVSSDTFCAVQLSATGGQRQNQLNWTAFEGRQVDSYQVQRFINGTWQRVGSVSGSDTSFIDSNNTRCNIPYDYRIQASWQDQGQSFRSLSDTASAVPFDTVNPEAPDVRAFSIRSGTSAELRWELSDGDVKQYELWLKQGNSGFQVRDTVGVQTRYTFNGLNTKANQYCARIVAIDSCSANRSGFSEIHCAVQLRGAAGNLENRLNWTAYRGFSNPDYVIQKKQNGRFRDLATVSSTSFTDTNNISCNVPETYRIQALNSSSRDSAYSDTLTLTPFDTIAPPTPQLQFASAQTNGDVQVQWNWQENTDQKYFEVWRDNELGNFQRLDTVVYDSTYTDQTARPRAIQHQYYIIATDSCAAPNRSMPSDTDRIMVPQATTGACRPENVLSWNAYNDLPKGVDQYEIYRNKQPATGNFQQITTINQQQTTYTDTNLNDTTTYCYRIRAVDTNSGFTAWTDSVCQEPFDYPVPDTAKIIRSSVARTGRSNGTVDITWQRYDKADTFARGYLLYHSTKADADSFDQLARIPDLSDTTFRHQGINTAEELNQYRLQVYNLCPDSGAFAGIHWPVNLQATNQNLSIRLDWFPYKGFPVQQYRIQKSTGGGPFRDIGTVDGSDTSLVDSSIRCGIEYSYKVFARGQKPRQVSVSDTVIRTGIDTIPPERPDLHRASVVATDSTNGEVELLFRGPPQANRKGYLIYQQSPGTGFTRIDSVNEDRQRGITITADDLNTDQTAQGFYVRAFDSCGNISMPSDTHRTIALTAEARNAYNQLNWSAYFGWGARSYEIQRRQPAGSGPWQTLTTVGFRQLSYRDSAVTCQKVYQYRIVGEESATGYQANSNTDTAEAFESTPPAPPVIRRASVTETGTTTGEVNLTWNPSLSLDAERYTIARSSDGQDFGVLDTLRTTSFTEGNLNTFNKPYYYRMRAIDQCDNISDSFSSVHQTINLTATGGNEQIALNWNPYQGRKVREYQIIRGGEVLYTVEGSTNRLIDERVICDSFYNYQVKAILSGNNITAFSNTDSAQSFDNNPPEPPYLQRATVTRFNDVVEVKWQASPEYDVTGYEVFRENGNGNLNLAARINSGEQTTFIDSFRIPGKQRVCYYVRALDACGNTGELSNQACLIQPEAEALKLKNRLTWPPYRQWRDGVKSYEVFKQEQDSFYNRLAELDSNSRQYTDQELKDSAERFCYYVRAEGFGEESFSRSTRVCLEQSAVVYIPNTFSPGVTPNTNDQFGPEGLYIDNYSMQVYNRWGEQVFSTSEGEKWDGRYQGKLVQSGLYHYQIRITSDNGRTKSFSGGVTVIR